MNDALEKTDEYWYKSEDYSDARGSESRYTVNYVDTGMLMISA